MEAKIFTDEWSIFIANLGRVTEKTFKDMGSPYDEYLLPTVHGVVEAMQSRKGEIREMVAEELKEPETAEGLEHLYNEFRFFNALAEKDGNTKQVVDAGKTIKDSFEKWFGKNLFKRIFWKRFFEVLNELLSLAKGAL